MGQLFSKEFKCSTIQDRHCSHLVTMFKRKAASVSADLARTKALAKPPHPVSNIRPLLLQSVFADSGAATARSPEQGSSNEQSTTPSSPVASTSKHHPYSLAELALPSASVDLPSNLIRMRQQLAAQDVAFRMLVNRLERESQHFWTTMNARFTHEKKLALQQGADEDAFDRQWLARHEAEYRAFHANFLKGQYRALWPAFLTKYRQWQWRWACWRAGVEHGLR